jgi:hypothetical protein
MKSNGRKHEGSGRDSIALEVILQHLDAHPEVLRPIDAGIVGRLYALIEGGAEATGFEPTLKAPG